jgi:hypothetical protein
MMTIVFSQLTMADFFGAGALTADIPFYGRGTIRIRQGSVQSATASLNLGAGYFARSCAPHPPQRGGRMARWAANDVIVIDRRGSISGPAAIHRLDPAGWGSVGAALLLQPRIDRRRP